MPIVPSVAMKGSMRADGGDQAVCKTAGAADEDGRNDGRRQHQRRIGNDAGIHEEDHHAGNEGHHRADRQIEIARRDHEGRADGDDRDEGAARRDIGEVGHTDEIRIDERPDDQEQHQGRKRGDSPKIDIPPAATATCPWFPR